MTNALRSEGSLGALAASGDGRIFAVEDERRVRVATAAGWMPEPALVADNPAHAITGIALDPMFNITRRVFAAVIETASDGTRQLSVVRYREVAGRLGEPAVVLTGIVLPPEGDAPFTVGADGGLFLAIPGEGSRSRDPYWGTILGFTADGTVPPGSRAMSPILAHGYTRPVALSGNSRGDELWLTGVDAQIGPFVARVALADSRVWPRVPAAASFGTSSAPPPVGMTLASSIDASQDDARFLVTPEALYRLDASGTVVYQAESVGALRDVAAEAGMLYLTTDDAEATDGSLLLFLQADRVR